MRHHRKTAARDCLDDDAQNMQARKDRLERGGDDADAEEAPSFLRAVRGDIYGDNAKTDINEAMQRNRNRHQKAKHADTFL